MNESIFRAEAIAHQERGQEEGDVMRFGRTWTVLAYRVIVAAALAAFVFASLFNVDEYATGPAIIRVEGRRIVDAPVAANIEEVSVRPGQWVAAGTPLLRMYGAEEENELARATAEYNRQLVLVLRDPGDALAKQSLAALRAKKEQAKNAVETRKIVADLPGYVSDVRVRAGQHVSSGDVLLAIIPNDSARISLVTMVSAGYRPLLRVGERLRFELDGFDFEYSDLTVTEVSAEAVGPAEVQRVLGNERADEVVLAPGAKIIVTATLPAATFKSQGQAYGYFDGLTGKADICVRSESILMTLIPALREWLNMT